MSLGNTRKDFKNVLALGEIDYNFNLELTDNEALFYKFDINQVKSLKDCKTLLQNSEIKDKIVISSKNNLINLLLFINKTNPTKSFTEFLSLNCLFLGQDLAFIKEKISSQFDENFLFLIESNILSPCKFKLNIKVGEGKSKSFTSELNESSKVTDENKNLDSKKVDDSKNMDDIKKTDDNNKADDNKKNEDAKKQEQKNNKPKSGNSNISKNEIILPNVSKPLYLKETKTDGVEGNHNLLNKIVYEFNICDYLFIDLNKFLAYKEISLTDLYDFLYEKLIHQYTKTKIVMIFPGIFNDFNQYNTFPLIDLLSFADIVIFDKRDAIKLTELLGYKVEEKNFEVRFMFIKELKKAKYKSHRTILFLDDFNNLSVVTQENETSLIIQHNLYNFDIGFRNDYFKVFTNNFEFLKFVFYGGFFSKVIQGCSYDEAFLVGKSSFLKLLDLLQNDLPIPNDPDYFVVHNVVKNKKENSKLHEVRDLSRKSKVLHSREAKRNNYSSASPSRIYSSKVSQANNNEESVLNNIIDAEQKRLMTILNANEKLQEKLNQLINSQGISKNLNFNPSKSMVVSKKLPNLNVNNSAQISKISNYNLYTNSSHGKKNKLKPISKESYGFMGYKSESFERLIDNKIKDNSTLNQDDLKNQMKIINSNNQTNISIKEKKPESSKKKQNRFSQSIENQFESFMKQMDEMNEIITKQKQLQPNQASTNVNNTSKSPVHHRQIERQKREMFPVCNLGYIPIIDQEVERIQNQLAEKKKYKDQYYWDQKHIKNKFKYLDRQKREMNELNKSTEEKGKREDYDDLNRSIDRQKRKLEEEENRKKMIEKERRERQEREEKEKKEKERKLKEQKEKDIKEQEQKEKEQKKLEEKKEKPKKPEEKK